MATGRYRGVVEGVSPAGVRGWIAPADGEDLPTRVTLRVGGEEEATILARLPREDVRAAGLSASGRCGFEYLFPRPVPAEALRDVVVVATDTGEALSRVAGDGLSLYDRLFAGSFAADNTIPEAAFLSPHYMRHNARRLEHLASLRLPLHRRSVIEYGAGVGDHTAFYLDRGCEVLATDVRPENLALLQRRLGDHRARDRVRTAVIDVDHPFEPPGTFDVVHCYGLVYHLANPAEALARMAESCAELFLLETKTDPGEGVAAQSGEENRAEVYHSFSGRNFRPTRLWLAAELRRHFAHVYFPRTTPSHEEFPAAWSDLSGVVDGWPRTIMIASRKPLDSDQLSADPPATMTPV
jgi:SAM-dependent methyltransferase